MRRLSTKTFLVLIATFAFGVLAASVAAADIHWNMINPVSVLYTATATATGGRNGHWLGRLADRERITLELIRESPPMSVKDE